jgi:serine/threonine protein kinase
MIDNKLSGVGFEKAIALKIFSQVFEATLWAHQHSVYHLDIKLDNIVYDPNSHKSQVIDWGMASFKLMSKAYRGSREYIAPEIIAGFGKTKRDKLNCEKLDVWCLGIVLFALLRGCFPFNEEERDTAIQSKSQHIDVDYSPIPRQIGSLIKGMLCLIPENRFSMSDVKHYLAIIINS